MDIYGVSHPIPTEYAKKIYNEGKTVFVGKSFLGKVSKNDKFIIYESWGAKAYTGWADIEFVAKMKPSEILAEYKEEMMINIKDFKEYSKNRKLMNVIKFKNFERFKNPIKPDKFVALSGKYIYKDEFKKIMSMKD